MKKLISICIAACLLCSFSYAETVWVLCQPDSYVNTRPAPSKHNSPNGYMECGWYGESDGTEKNGFVYLESLSNEDGYGWVSAGFAVYAEPVIKTFRTNIYSNGRVACWNNINGKRNCWLNNGDIVTVYALSDEWAVTNKGFIKTEHLGVNYNGMLRLEERQANAESAELYWEDD